MKETRLPSFIREKEKGVAKWGGGELRGRGPGEERKKGLRKRGEGSFSIKFKKGKVT